MTDRLEELFEKVRTLSAERRADAEAILESLVNEPEGVYELSEDERIAIRRSQEQAQRGEFATDEEVAAVWRKHGL